MPSSVRRPLVAAELMQRDILTISPDETLRDALELMTENHITGLPVMDSMSRCIGLVTASDILSYEEEHADEVADGRTLQHFNPDTQQWESVPVSAFGLEEFGEVRVEEVMSRDLIWVKRDTPIRDVARKMVDAEIHRILVMDDYLALFGVISAFDFVRLVAES